MLRNVHVTVTASALLCAPLAFAQETGTQVLPQEEEVEAASEEGETRDEETHDKTASDDAGEDDGPRLTTESDWLDWERIGQTALSPDGRWVAYSIGRGDGTSELRLRVIASDAVETFEQGTRPTFSSDGKWLAFAITKSDEQREALQKKKKPVVNDLGLFDLVGGERTTVEGIGRFSFSEDGAFLAMQRSGVDDGKDSSGADVIVRELVSGIDTHFGRVGTFSWSDEGALLAMTVDAPGRTGNSVRVVDAHTGQLRTLASEDADFIGLSWRDDAFDLAVMTKTEYEDDEDATLVVHAFRGVDGDKPKATSYDHLDDESFPEDLRVVDLAGLRWAEDGETLFFGLKEWEERPAKLDEEAEDEESGDDAGEKSGDDGDTKNAGSAQGPAPDEKSEEGDEESGGDEKNRKSMRESLDEAPGVEIWHAKDIDIIPRQKRTASSDERQSYLAALHLEGKKLVRLETESVDRVTLLENEELGIGYDEGPYETEQRFSATHSDIYSVDVTTGEQDRLLERVKYVSTGDPTGRRFLFVRDDHVFAYDLESGESTNLTEGQDTKFINQENSSLTDQKPMYGVAGWTEDGDAVLLYSRYDIWHFPFDGGVPKALTAGADQALRHRRTRVAADPDEDRYIDLDDGFYVSLYGDRSKKSGYGRVSSDGVKTLMLEDAQISRLGRAEDADIVSFTRERFDDSPDLFVASGDLAKPKQVSETNAFADEFLWGRSELIDYENAGGVPLQGALFYPADYDPEKTYPMIVYIYELRSQTLHSYQRPSERSPYNTAVFTQNGYFVFQPDIVYRAQNPGLSAVECVVPATRKVLETGMIDPDRVGLVGHSWGAYQTAFIVTQTDLFAAGVAGAPLTNMMSMSMSIYWNSGQTDAYIFHESQGRMDRPFWKDVDTYIANSPIFSIDNLETPLLVAFGDEDGAVDWQQGIEMYNAARLAERPFVMLVYPGENHGLAKKPNQVDYHHRVRQWFDTYLKGEETPQWISDGMPWLEQKKALEELEGKKGE